MCVHRRGDAHGCHHSFLKGVPLSHASSHTGGNPRICPGSNVVIVASLLEGVAWYAAFRSARSVVGILRRAQRLRIIIVFVDPTLSTLLSFLFYFCFSFISFFFWARLYCGPSKLTVSCGCYINIAGREPVSRGLEHACILVAWTTTRFYERGNVASH
jgi:hypothetical protein